MFTLQQYHTNTKVIINAGKTKYKVSLLVIINPIDLNPNRFKVNCIITDLLINSRRRTKPLEGVELPHLHTVENIESLVLEEDWCEDTLLTHITNAAMFYLINNNLMLEIDPC